MPQQDARLCLGWYSLALALRQLAGTGAGLMCSHPDCREVPPKGTLPDVAEHGDLVDRCSLNGPTGLIPGRPLGRSQGSLFLPSQRWKPYLEKPHIPRREGRGPCPRAQGHKPALGPPANLLFSDSGLPDSRSACAQHSPTGPFMLQECIVGVLPDPKLLLFRRRRPKPINRQGRRPEDTFCLC